MSKTLSSTLTPISTTGSGSVVLANSAILVTPNIGTPVFGNLTNCIFPSAPYDTANTALTTGQIAFTQANSAYTQANVALTTGQSAFTQANTAYNQANTGITIGQGAFGQANVALTTGQSAFTQANTALTTGQTAFTQANSAFTQANVGILLAQSAFSQANSGYSQANAAYNTANTKFSANGGTIYGSVTITTDLSVTGNVYLSGNVTTISSNNISISDPLIYLAQDNPANIQDIGIVGHFTTDHYQHTGLVRDATDGIWKFFSNVAAEPTSTIDFTGAVYDTIQVGSITASNASFTVATGSAPFLVASNTLVSNLNADLLDGQHGTYYTGLSASAFGQANSAFNQANSAFTQANVALTTGQSAFSQANTALTTGQSAFNQANSAYTQANTALTIGQSAFGQANSGLLTANAAFTKANSIPALISTTVQTANYVAVANDLVRCNTAAGAFSVTLPASPTDGAMIAIVDVAGTFNANNVTLLPNGKTIENDATSLLLDMNGAYVSFVYSSSTSNWKLLETPLGGLTPTAIITSAYTAVINDIVRCNSSNGAFSITLPTSPSDGSLVNVVDVAGTFYANNVTLLRGGSNTIEGDTSVILDINNAYASFMYNTATANWRLLETPIGSLGNVTANTTVGGIVKISGTVLANATAGVDYMAAVAPGDSNNILTSNGTSWVSTTSTAASTGKAIAMSIVFGGG